MWWLTDHEEPTRQGSRHRQNAPYQRMRTADGSIRVRTVAPKLGQHNAEIFG